MSLAVSRVISNIPSSFASSCFSSSSSSSISSSLLRPASTRLLSSSVHLNRASRSSPSGSRTSHPPRPLHRTASHKSRCITTTTESIHHFFTSHSPSPTVKLAPNRSYSTASTRLSLISRHLETHHDASYPPINTPYTTERTSLPFVDDDLPYNPPPPPTTIPRSRSPSHTQKRSLSTSSNAKMSTQAAHPSLLIPGPIEISDEVSQSMSHYAQSHVGQPFVNTFGETLTLLRDLFQTKNPNSQPFVLAGSGTLGWDLVAANLIEPGEDVLVLHTGYFADSFADAISTYGGKPTQLKAPIGDRPQLPEIEAALKEKQYKALTVTHVDTSTGVLSHIKPLAELIQRVSPDTLLVVDGVCSIGGEELAFDEWSVDVALTASQKAIGCPPGLSITMVSEKAINVYKARKTPPGSYYASFKNWLPIMQNYESKKPSYFATPPTQLIQALNTSLKQVLANPISERFAQHRKISQYVKSEVTKLGLKQLPTDPANAANTMTAIYLPEGLTPPEILPKLMSRGVIFAGGLHREIAARYIRFGHMGISSTDESRGEVDKALQALKEGLAEIDSAKKK